MISLLGVLLFHGFYTDIWDVNVSDVVISFLEHFLAKARVACTYIQNSRNFINMSCDDILQSTETLVPIKRLRVSTLVVKYLVYLSSQYSAFPYWLISYNLYFKIYRIDMIFLLDLKKKTGFSAVLVNLSIKKWLIISNLIILKSTLCDPSAYSPLWKIIFCTKTRQTHSMFRGLVVFFEDLCFLIFWYFTPA